jgi:nucleoside phosphorylase
MGQLNAAIATSDLIADFSPKAILLVGIAAGIADEVRLGDVVVSDQLIDYEPGKLTPDGTRPNFPVYKSTSSLLAKLEDFHSPDWKVKVRTPRPDGAANLLPAVHFGDVFSGNKVVADDQAISELKRHFRKAIALEMESVGIAALLNQRESPPHFAMVKAICDRGDAKKDDRWQQYAADAAAAYALAFLDDYELVVGSREFITKSEGDIEREVEHVIEFVAPDLNALQPFEHDLVRQIVAAGIKEVGDVLSGRYQADVGLGRHFLLRAAPLFGKARHIYATSLDSVSTFWTNPDNRAEAVEYLRHQAPAGSARRLFVFSDPDSAHYHAKVLDHHEESYHNVYICSIAEYRTLLATFAAEATVEQLLDRDFAILGYNEHLESGTHLFAELDAKHLEYQRIQLDVPGAVSYRNMLGVFERLKRVERGDVCSSCRVLRWKQGLWQDREVWAERLKSMFDERTFDAVHMVFFQVPRGHREERLRRRLADIKRDVLRPSAGTRQSMRKRYGVKNVWIGRRMQYPHELRDGVYHGKLMTGTESAEPYVLIMHFADENGLMQFYADKEHSVIRQRVYEEIDPRLAEMYAATKEGPLSSDHGKEVAYEFIESLASQRLRRLDYRDDEMITEMVRTVQPYDF